MRRQVRWLLALVTCVAVEVAADDVRLDLPETVELKAVVDYIAVTLGLNVIYDESQLTKTVSLRTTEPVPRESLLGLLRTVLRSRGLALVPAEQTGWLKIIPVEQIASEGGPLARELPPPEVADGEVVTYLLPMRQADLEAVKTALTPYLTKGIGTVLAAPEARLLVVTDFADKVRRAAEIAELLDATAPTVGVETIPVRHQDPRDLAATVTTLLSEQARLDVRAKAAPALALQPDPLSGGLIAIGPPDQLAHARILVEQFDQPIERRTELYQPRYIAANRLRTLIEQMLPTAGAKLAADEPSNTLVVTAPADVHRRIGELLARFDTAPPESATPLRFYKLLNRRADDAFATIGMLLMGAQTGTGTGSTSAAKDAEMPRATSAHPLGSSGSAVGEAHSGGLQIPPRPPQAANSAAGGGAGAAVGIQGDGFALSLDLHTNSIIALATPERHQQIEQLVRALDQRRPQVLVEVTLVSVTVDDSLNLGVELQTQDLDNDPWRFELFSSFGLGTIDPTTGARHLTPAMGGTGVLLAPDEVPIIVQALANSGKTRVYSAPRILVDDNATGTIESVAESPFTSVNASDTVATTSFAGFAKAGTQLTIEPHIAEGDHLEINYSLSVSSFTGAATGTAPPPRSSDTITSTIRVPDGHTVIVGGLLTETLGESSSHVPLIGDVPILGLLFGTNSQSKSKVRLYAFIRPTVLRHESFEDLKYISKDGLDAAGLDDDYPPSRWQYMH
jgi:general secretion pathway protein D